MPIARRQHSAVYHPNGLIYIWGGWNGNSLLTSMQIYDPQANLWTNSTPSPMATRGSAYCLGTDDYIYQLSGIALSGKNNSCYKFNPVTNVWTPIASIPTSVWEASAVCYNSKIYVFGGETDIMSASGPCDLVQIYDIATNTWSSGAQMPEVKMQHKAVLSGNDVFVFAGRTGSNGGLLSNTVLKYSVLSNTWASLGGIMPAGEKNSFGACLGPDNNIYLIGGKDNFFNDTPPFFNTVNVFDPYINSFRVNEASIPFGLGENVALAGPSGIYSIGGTNGNASEKIYYLNPCENYININGGLLICPGEQKILTAYPANASNYIWSNGETTQSISVGNPGSYNVTIDGYISCNSITIRDNSLNGIYSVGSGQMFRTLTEAVEAYNTKCLSGPVTFLLTDNSYPDEVFPITINANTFASVSNTLIIRPANGTSVNRTAAVNSNAIIRLIAADYITIDGSNNGSGSRDWTINNLSTVNSASVWLASSGPGRGCNYVTIKNLNLSGGIDYSTFNYNGLNAAVLIAESINGASGYDNSNITIGNNYISKVGYGVYAPGVVNTNDNLKIINNVIGPGTLGVNQIGTRGIYLFQQNNALIKGNNIQCIGIQASQPATNGIDRYGLLAANCQGVVIDGNKIHDEIISGPDQLLESGRVVQMQQFQTI